jgi:hypothetical protein
MIAATLAGSGLATWADLAAADPALAAAARSLLERSGTGEGLLATVCLDAPPRIHPVSVAIVDGRLLTVVLAGSAKAADLLADGRYALHAHQDPAAPHELLLRGRAIRVTDPAERVRLVAGWAFDVPADALVLDLRIEQALLGERADPDAWPPAYRSVRPAAR